MPTFHLTNALQAWPGSGSSSFEKSFSATQVKKSPSVPPMPHHHNAAVAISKESSNIFASKLSLTPNAYEKFFYPANNRQIGRNYQLLNLHLQRSICQPLSDAIKLGGGGVIYINCGFVKLFGGGWRGANCQPVLPQQRHMGRLLCNDNDKDKYKDKVVL